MLFGHQQVGIPYLFQPSGDDREPVSNLTKGLLDELLMLGRLFFQQAQFVRHPKSQLQKDGGAVEELDKIAPAMISSTICLAGVFDSDIGRPHPQARDVALLRGHVNLYSALKYSFGPL